MKSMFWKFVPFVCAAALTACGGGAKTAATTPIPAQPEYKKIDLAAGTGETVVAGDLATVEYTGYLYDDTKPNSRGTQFETGTRSFAAGTGAVLPGTTYALLGWDQGVPGMKVEGKANLVMPYNLAYGIYEYTSPQSGVKVPQYAPVVFEVKVVAVKKASPSASVKIANNEVVGTGALVEYNKQLTVKYTGWLYDDTKADKKGTQFDSSASATGGVFSFALGGQVIPGWDRGLLGMKVGGKRTLTIPYELAYGVDGQPMKDSAGNVVKDAAGNITYKIPPKKDLIFDIELVAVK